MSTQLILLRRFTADALRRRLLSRTNDHDGSDVNTAQRTGVRRIGPLESDISPLLKFPRPDLELPLLFRRTTTLYECADPILGSKCEHVEGVFVFIVNVRRPRLLTEFNVRMVQSIYWPVTWDRGKQ
jgi:hypothetical protein